MIKEQIKKFLISCLLGFEEETAEFVFISFVFVALLQLAILIASFFNIVGG